MGDERDWSPSWRGPPLCACVCDSPCKCASVSAYLPPCVTVSASWKRLLSARNSACLYNDRGKDVSSIGRSSLHSSWHVRSDGGRDWLMAHGKHRRGRPIHHPPFTTLSVLLDAKSPIVHRNLSVAARRRTSTTSMCLGLGYLLVSHSIGLASAGQDLGYDKALDV